MPDPRSHHCVRCRCPDCDASFWARVDLDNQEAFEACAWAAKWSVTLLFACMPAWVFMTTPIG